MDCEWSKIIGIVIGITLVTTYAVTQTVVLTGDGMPPDGSTVPVGSALTLTCSCPQNAAFVSFWQQKLTDISPIRRMRMGMENNGNCFKVPTDPSGLSSCTCVNQQVYKCTIERIELANKKDVWNCQCITDFSSYSNKLAIDIAVGITGVSLSPLPPVKMIAQREVNIVCTTNQGFPAATVHWFRENSKGDLDITSLSISRPTQNGEGLYVVTSTLTLSTSKEDNNMKVYCNASNVGTWYKSNLGTIEVLYGPDPPSCTYGSSPVSGTIIVTKGSTLTIQCSSISNPLPVFTWTLPNSSTLAGAQLSVPDIQPSLKGSFKIQVQNSMTPTGGDTVQGTNSLTINVDVQYPPSLPHFRISSTPVTGTVKIIEGESYTFRCESDSNPTATYIWSHPKGQTFPNQSTLSLTKPVAANDKGEYVCRAENTLTPTGGQAQSQSSSASLIVDILYSARTLYFKYGSISGDSVHGNAINIIRNASQPIACIADSNPIPIYMWGGQEGSSQLLNVNHIQSTWFKQCTVTTTLIDTFGRTVKTTNSSRLQIIVLYPPEIPDVALYYNISSTIVNIYAASVLEGDSFYLQCSAKSNPNSSYIWNNQPAAQGIYHMTNISRNPSLIQARCSANNIMATSFNGLVPGSSSTTVNISVLYGPKISALFSQDAIRGQKFQQTCQFTPGNPAHTTFRWTRSSATETWTVQTEQTLVINSVQRSDDSNYTCEVSNVLNRTVGTSIATKDNESFHLNVLFGAEKVALIVIGYIGQRNVTVNEGEEHILTCSLESNPESTMVIKKDGTEVVRALNRILEYTIHSNCKAAGLYTCSGGNDHGSADADNVNYFVKCSARQSPFVEINNNVSSPQAVNITLSFYTQAYPDPQYTWQRCTDTCINISDGTDYNITSNGLISNLTILNVEESDYGSYKVIANNGIGAAWNETFQLIPIEKPSIPTSFHVVENTITSSEVILAWTPGFNGGPQQTFHIKYKPTSAITCLSTSVNDTGELYMNATIRDLVAGTEYQAFLFSQNRIGSSPKTTYISFTTAQDQVASLSGTKAGMIAGSIVGAIIGLFTIVMTVVALRKYELMCICKCVRKSETTGQALYEASAVSAINNGEYESIGNPHHIRGNQHAINNIGNDNVLEANAYESLDAHQSNKHVYSDLGRKTGKGKTRPCEHTAVHLDSGRALYVNTTFENA